MFVQLDEVHSLPLKVASELNHNIELTGKNSKNLNSEDAKDIV